MISLKTLPQATAQEVFDQVSIHLMAQKEKSYLPNTKASCAYRGDNGSMCAAGCLIADNEYNPEFERFAWKSLSADKLVPLNHVKLVSELQQIHDHISVDEWGKYLRNLAKEYGFTCNWESKQCTNLK